MNDLIAIVSASLANVTDDLIQQVYYEWPGLCKNIRGRNFLRTFFTEVIRKRGDNLVYSLTDTSLTETQVHMPDLFLFLYPEGQLNIPIQCAVEDMAVKLVMRKSKSQETILSAAVRQSVCIPFFDKVCAINMKWNLTLHKLRNGIDWAIPPKAAGSMDKWYVTVDVFQRRLTWYAPFLIQLLNHSTIRRLGGVLSGSLIPLCVLNHEVYTETQDQFLAYANELYKDCAISLFVCQQKMSHTEVTNLVCDVLDEMCSRVEWASTDVQEWNEDEDLIRMRRGITTTIIGGPWRIHVIYMPSTDVETAMMNQHLPPLRAWWDGHTLFATSKCTVSWMMRFVNDEPLFGNLIDRKRQSKIVFKYAMRGFGFSMNSVTNLQLPSTLMVWLRESKQHCPLPWYHPLYNPSIWHKAMTKERERKLLSCVDI
jgi:hypothetical protein